MTPTTAELLGYNKRWMWLRIPYRNAHRVLTLPRATLLRGYATANEINVKVDLRTLRTTGHGYTAKVELLDVLSTRRTNEAVDSA